MVKITKKQDDAITNLFTQLQRKISEFYAESHDEDFREIFHKVKDIEVELYNKLEVPGE